MDAGPVCGYAWPQSVLPGESFGLHLSSTAGPVDIEIARLGVTREVVWEKEALQVGAHPYPEGFTEHGCGWPPAATVTVGDWRSGYYEIVASDAGGTAVGVAFVVVRARAEQAGSILLELSTNTWNAYNDVENGLSLYTGARSVSFCRPMAPGYLRKPPGLGWRVNAIATPDPLRGAHRGYKAVHHLSDWVGSAGWPNWEYPFIRWAESHGYALDYCVNADLQDPAVLAGYRLMLSVGHDEYWSGPMRDTVEAFIADGGNVAFLSGNTAFWQVRVEESGTRMIGYKDAFEQDPCYGTSRQHEVTTMWSDRILRRPENHMTGVSFTRGGYHRIGMKAPEGAGGYTVHRPEHWLFDGTGLEYGDVLGAASVTVGYECDGCDMQFADGRLVPTGADGTPENFEILATAPAAPFDRRTAVRPVPDGDLSEAELVAGRVLGDASPASCRRLASGHAVLGAYTRGGTVVTSGSTEWVHGLDGKSPRVELITHNIVRRLAGESRSGRAEDSGS
ncbi:MAG TPA: N,N-dimethylformamidase beta subunit family domain-containing protein [Trebonia sp.]